MNHLNTEHIQVDPHSGKASGRIPIATLVANNRVGPTFDVNLVYRGMEDDWQLATTRIRKLPNNEDEKLVFEVTLASGATFMMSGTRLTCPTFVVNIDPLGASIYHRDGTVETLREVGPDPCNPEESSDFKFIPDKYKPARDEYVKLGIQPRAALHYVLESIATPLGHQLTFEWRIWHEDRRAALARPRRSHYRLHAIKDEKRTLLVFDEKHPHRPEYFKVFPGAGDAELKYTLLFADVAEPDQNHTAFYQYGDGKRTKTVLTPVGFSHRLTSISVGNEGGRSYKREVGYEQGFLASIKSYISGAVSASEVLFRTDGKVVSCERHSIAGMKMLTTRYSYGGVKESQVFTAETDDAAKTKIVRHFNAAGRQTKEETTAYGVTRVVEQNISIDPETKRTVGTSLEYLMGQPESQVIVKWEMDGDGHLMKLERDNLVTVYTYCTTMHHTRKSLEELKDSNNDFWSYMFYPVDEILWAAGARSGLTWAKEEKRALTKEAAGFSPGKELYNLPMPLSYPGERCGFDRFVESEVIYREDGDSVSTIQAKFYSYKALKPKRPVGTENITNGDVPVIDKVLTVLEPDIMRINVGDQRYAALIAAGDEVVKWMDGLPKDGRLNVDFSKEPADPRDWAMWHTLNDLEEKLFQKIFIGLVETSEVRKDNLKHLVPIISKKVAQDLNALKQQAVRGSNRWKLASHKGSMTVETIDYSTGQTDYGLPSRIQVHVINKSGAKIANSNVDTVIQREYLDDGFVLSTDVTSEDGSKAGTKVKYSSLTGHVLDQGKVVGAALSKSADKAAPASEASRRMIFDDLGRQIEEQMDRCGKTHVLSTIKYDEYGRVAEQATLDYLANGDKLTEHTVTSSYDDMGNRTVARTLRDGGGETIDTLTDVYSTTPAGLTTLTRGASVFKRQYDADKKTVTEWEEKAFPYLKTVTSYGSEGRVEKIEHFNVTAKDKEASLAHRTLEHDGAGRCTKVSQTGSQDRTWKYDAFGRATELVSGGVTVKNTYPDHTSAAVATKASLADGASTVELGTQKCDGFGRVTTLHPKGLAETPISYVDGGMSWGRDSSVTEPGSLFHNPKKPLSPPPAAPLKDLGGRFEIPMDQVGFNPYDEMPLVIHAVVHVSGEPGSDATEPESETREPESLPLDLPLFSSTLDLASLTYSETYDGRTSESTYSVQGSFVQFKDIAGNTTRLTYDLHGRISKISTADKAETVLEYNSEGRLLKETVKDLSTKKDMVITFAYDVMGRETRRTFTCAGFETLSIDRTLLSDGRLEKSTLNVKGEEHRSDNYEYQNCGRLGAWSCTGKNPPKNYKEQPYTSQKFNYDALGNLLKLEGKSSEGDLVSAYTFSDNVPGQIMTEDGRPVVNDPRGRVIKFGLDTISYHPNGQVKSFDRVGSAQHYELNYDNLGCIRSLVSDHAVLTYHYRGNSIYAMQRVMKPSPASTLGWCDRTIVLLNESSGCLLQQIHTKESLEGDAQITTSFELRDAAGTIFASYDLSTEKVEYFSYTPYGYRSPGGFGEITWLGFKGEPMSPMGLYHLGKGYRLYDPENCRFHAPDSWSPFGWGGANRYSYCSNDPVNYGDPRGHRLEVWSERRRVDDPLLNDPMNIVGVVAGIISVALAPFSCGGSIGLRIAAGLMAAGLGGVSTVSMVIQKKHPELSALLDGLTLVSGRGIGSAFARAGRNSRLARTALAGRPAPATTRTVSTAGRLGDAVDALGAGMLAKSLYDIMSSQGSTDSGNTPVVSALPFLAENPTPGLYAPASFQDLPAIPVDQFLASCTPLQDAIARVWDTQEKIDVAAVLKAYMLSAGTLAMENRGPLAAGNKMLNDLAMYGVHYTDPDGMYCRGNSPASLAEVSTGFRPLA